MMFEVMALSLFRYPCKNGNCGGGGSLVVVLSAPGTVEGRGFPAKIMAILFFSDARVSLNFCRRRATSQMPFHPFLSDLHVLFPAFDLFHDINRTNNIFNQSTVSTFHAPPSKAFSKKLSNAYSEKLSP